MEEQKLFGKLFNTIPLHDENHLETILVTMNKETSMFLIIEAIKFSHRNGVFSIGETEVISKAIRVMTKEEPKSTED
jgi:hypothetical protein